MPTALFSAGRAILRRKVNDTTAMDFDGAVVLPAMLPVFVCNPVHVWGWRATGSTWSWVKSTKKFAFRSMPIRWSMDLVVRTLLRHWLWLPAVTGLVFTLSCAHGPLARAAGLGLLLASLAAWAWVIWSDRRHQRIRRLLGRHRLGYSDPATWPTDLLDALPDAQDWFGERTFAAAARKRLKQGRLREALWAARLCVALEDEAEGERLTREVLADPEAADAATRKPGRGEDTREFPPPDLMRIKAGSFWARKLTEDGSESYESTTYAGHVAGEMAAAVDDDDEPEMAHDSDDYRERAGPGSRGYFLGSAAMVFALIFGVVAFAVVANFDRGPDLAARQAGLPNNGPPANAPADPGPRPPKRDPVAAAALPGLLAYWPLDEGAGDEARSGVGPVGPARRHHADWVAGIRGKALAFDGKTAYLELPPGPPLDFGANRPFTVSCWFNSRNGEGTVLSFHRKDHGAPVLDVYLARWQVRATVRADDREIGHVTLGGGTVNDGWHHVAVLRDDQGEVRVYVDGWPKERGRADNTSGKITTDLRALGCERYWLTGIPGGQPYFVGAIDEFAVFDRLLTPKEIADLAGQDPPP